jgi:hypothetical protein
MAKKTEIHEKRKRETGASHIFVSVLAVVSIIGFASIISENWFVFKLLPYVEFLIFIALGIGFLIESEPKLLFRDGKGLDNRNFERLTTFVIGCLATTAGILSFPYINVQHFVFLSIKGLISLIAIIFIVIQTWFVKN